MPCELRYVTTAAARSRESTSLRCLPPLAMRPLSCSEPWSCGSFRRRASAGCGSGWGSSWPCGGGRGGGRYPQQERPDGKKILQQISKATGGRLYEVSKKETVDKIYAEIEEELRNQYSLAYTPEKNEGPGYHKIAVTTKQKDLLVQARDGYYATQPLTQ